MSDENKAIARQAYDNFKAGNIEALLNLLSDDVSWTLPEMEGVSFGGKRTGRAAVAEFFSIVNDVQESLRLEPQEFIAEGDKVVVTGTYDWRVKATGREFGGDWAHVWTIRDGKAVTFHEYTDTAAAVSAHQKAMSA